MEQEGPWESMHAEQENGELLSEEDRTPEATKELQEDEPQSNVKEGIFRPHLPVHSVYK